MQNLRRTMENGSEKDVKKASILESKKGPKIDEKNMHFEPSWGSPVGKVRP